MEARFFVGGRPGISCVVGKNMKTGACRKESDRFLIVFLIVSLTDLDHNLINFWSFFDRCLNVFSQFSYICPQFFDRFLIVVFDRFLSFPDRF